MVNNLDYEKILHNMTLEQKISFLSGDGDWFTKEIPELGLFHIFMADGPNGLRIEKDAVTRDSFPATCYPAMAALASTWDRELVKKLAENLAEECRTASLDLLLGPGANIKRSPLCGRNFEYLSEDPYLTSEMAYSYVMHLQECGVGACLKHFAVNNQEFCRMTVNARVRERALREIYLKCFEKTVKQAKPDTVMSSYNKLNGVQMSESPLLQNVLRDEWGFDGVVISDWGSISNKDRSIIAGMDLEMPDSHGKFDEDVYCALKDGTLTEMQIDACVMRILKLVEKRIAKRQKLEGFSEDTHHNLAREIAERSMVLLKNERNLLPISKNKKVAVLGEFAKIPRYQGGGSAHVQPNQLEVPFDYLGKVFPKMIYEQGYSLSGEKSEEKIRRAVEVAKQTERVIIFAGLPEEAETECYDRITLDLPEVQIQLINEVAKVNENVIVVLFAGSAVTMPWKEKVKAILMAYLPGEAIGSAISRVLSGEVEPTGRLAETFPVRLEDTPSFGAFPGDGKVVDYSEGIFVGYRWYDKRKIEPQFAFGQGQGYTIFEYGVVSASKKTLGKDEVLVIKVPIRNIGKRRGREVVQLYVSQQTGRWGYVRQLKGFEVIELEAGACGEVSFCVETNDLAIWSESEQRFLVQDDNYYFEVGHHSRDIRGYVEVAVHTGDYEHARLNRDVNVLQLLADPNTAELGREIYERMIHDRMEKNKNFERSQVEKMGQSLFLSYPARNFVDVCSSETAMELEQMIYERKRKEHNCGNH